MSEINIDLFTQILADSIRERSKKLRKKVAMKLNITEFQIREIESMFKMDVHTRTQEIINDVLIDLIEVLEIDYEVDRKRGLKLLNQEGEK